MGGNHLSSNSDLTQTESVFCGASAGLITRFVVAPLDLVKIRLQLDRHTSFFTLISQIARKEGIGSFWKGNAPAELLYVVYSGVQFSTLRLANQFLGERIGIKNEQVKQVLAGGIAGSTATFVLYPLDFLRTRGAANLGPRPPLSTSIRHIYAHSGISGFYHGCSATTISVFPYMGLFFGTYSYLRDSVNANKAGHYGSMFTASSIASVVSKAAVYPLDTIRKRVQVHGTRVRRDALHAGYGNQYSHNFLKAGTQIVAKDGIKGLYRGLLVSLVKAWPVSFISIMVFEATLSVIRPLTSP